MIRFAENRYRKPGIYKDFAYEMTAPVRRLHSMTPGYSETPLADLKSMAKTLGIKALLVKDESSRFGLKAFKGLGGIYAMYRIICRKFNLDPETTTLEQLRAPKFRNQIRDMTFITTTDGNHGKGVSWASGIFGCRSYVYMPEGSAPVRADAIRNAGNAQVTITDMLYDDCVAMTGAMAKERGWYLIQDTDCSDDAEVPLWIMQGYTTMFYEAVEQMKALGYDRPTHIFLQAGVGSMAGAVAAAAACEYKDIIPAIITAEPHEVACFYESFAKNDGKPHKSTGRNETIMAGLNCAIPCTAAWNILRDTATGGISCSDEITRKGMRMLAHPAPGDNPVISGESGAVTAGLAAELMMNQKYSDLRDRLGLNKESVIFVISTEGDTDPENYRNITGS